METESVTLTELRQNLSDIVNRVACGNTRIVLVSRGKAKTALISLEDLRHLEIRTRIYSAKKRSA